MIIFLGGNSVRSLFSSRPQYAILGTGILGQISSFERRLRGAALSSWSSKGGPLPLNYPYVSYQRSKSERCVLRVSVFSITI